MSKPQTSTVRENRKTQIVTFFVAHPLRQRFSSKYLHERFGSAFRTRASEINRDPACPIIIRQDSAPPSTRAEFSFYWAEPRPLKPAPLVPSKPPTIKPDARGALFPDSELRKAALNRYSDPEEGRRRRRR